MYTYIYLYLYMFRVEGVGLPGERERRPPRCQQSGSRASSSSHPPSRGTLPSTTKVSDRAILPWSYMTAWSGLQRGGERESER